MWSPLQQSEQLLMLFTSPSGRGHKAHTATLGERRRATSEQHQRDGYYRNEGQTVRAKASSIPRSPSPTRQCFSRDRSSTRSGRPQATGLPDKHRVRLGCRRHTTPTRPSNPPKGGFFYEKLGTISGRNSAKSRLPRKANTEYPRIVQGCGLGGTKRPIADLRQTGQYPL